jgi:hypothetical protein
MVERTQKLVLCARRYHDSESHRSEYPEDIVTTGANGVAADPVVSEGGPSSDLDGFSGSLRSSAWIFASARHALE